MKTYTMDASLVAKFEDKLAKFTKKFNKYGNGTITYEKSEPRMEEIDHRKVLVVDITVDASYQISGYEFIALLEWNDSTKCNLVKSAQPEITIPNEYRFSTSCEHCNTLRMRKYTVLLRNVESGEFKQVGKACVKDYLGRDMTDYASYLSFFDSLDDEHESLCRGGYSATVAFTFDEIVLQTLEYVRRFGYMSKSKSYECEMPATSTRIFNALNKMTNYYGELIEEEYPITESSVETLGLIKDWILHLDDSNSDYYYNLKVLMDSSYIENKNLGLAVSAVGSYLREMGKKEDAKREVVSNYVGNVGERIEITTTPECVYEGENDFGYYYIYKMVVGDDVLVWKTNKWLTPETEITLKATVKGHSEYRGVKQTELTRGKVVGTAKETEPKATISDSDADKAFDEFWRYINE